MTDKDHTPRSGPFDMGWQGYLVITIILLDTAYFASTQSNWTSMVIAAVVPPLIVFPVLFAVGRRFQDRPDSGRSAGSTREPFDLISFMAMTNPVWLVFFTTLGLYPNRTQGQQGDDAGPYGLERDTYLVALVLLLTPLFLALLISAVTCHLPTHTV